jgi:hypothetical protein
MQRPDCFLMLAGERLDRSRVSAQRRQRAVQVRAQDVREHRSIARVGFAPGLAGPFSITGHRPRVDRMHREPSLHRCDDKQVLVSFDRDRRVLDAATVFGNQRKHGAESGYAGIDPSTGYQRAVIVDQRDVVMRLRPIDPARQFHPRLLLCVVVLLLAELEVGAAT